MFRPDIHAVIGAWYRDGKTFYVRRSEKMENYPGVWSLLSIQYVPSDEDIYDFGWVQAAMDRVSEQRLGGIGIRVKKYLSSASCADNPMRKRVRLHMYRVELEREPEPNPDFYTASAWLTPEEYQRLSVGGACGLCMRMWSDYCVRRGLAKHPFAPPAPVEG